MSTNMPSQLTSLLQHPGLVDYNERFSDLFRSMPQEYCPVFSSCLASTLHVVRATLPPAFTSHLPENLALYPYSRSLLAEITSTLTICQGIVFTTVKLFFQPSYVRDLFSIVLIIVNTGLYGNPSFDLSALINSFHSAMIYPVDDQPYVITLTNFPQELLSMVYNTQTSVLRPLPAEFNDKLFNLVHVMILDLSHTLGDQSLHEELQDALNDGPAAPDYHIEELTVQYVYQARGDTDTDPDKCSICLQEMKDEEYARRLCCLHNFHVQCIDRWLQTKRSCPLCRTPIDATHD